MSQTNEEITAALTGPGARFHAPELGKGQPVTDAEQKGGHQPGQSISVGNGLRDLPDPDAECHGDGAQVQDFHAVQQALADGGFEPASAELTLQPSTTVKLVGQEAEQMLRLADSLRSALAKT